MLSHYRPPTLTVSDSMNDITQTVASESTSTQKLPLKHHTTSASTDDKTNALGSALETEDNTQALGSALETEP
jgi:hypothetical protein